MSLLIKAGADLDHQSKDGDTALMNAASANQYDVVLELLKAGANYRIKGPGGYDVRFLIDMSTQTMTQSGSAWKMLQEVIAFLKARDFWPPPKSQQFH